MNHVMSLSFAGTPLEVCMDQLLSSAKVTPVADDDHSNYNDELCGGDEDNITYYFQEMFLCMEFKYSSNQIRCLCQNKTQHIQ